MEWRVLERDVGDGDCPSVQVVYTDCPYCIIDGACANSPKCKDCRKVDRSERDEQNMCKQKVWEQNSVVLEHDVGDESPTDVQEAVQDW